MLHRPAIQIFSLLFLQLFFAAQSLADLQNVTVDDQSGELTFTGNWTQAQYVFDAWNNTNSFTSKAGSTVSFQFTGVAVYVNVSGSRYSRPFIPKVDDEDLSGKNGSVVGDEEAVQMYSSVIWGVNNLTNSQHLLTLTTAENQSWQGEDQLGNFVLDSIIYTKNDTSTSTSSNSTVPSSSSGGSSSNTGILAGSVIGGIALASAILTLLYKIFQHAGLIMGVRKKLKDKKEKISGGYKQVSGEFVNASDEVVQDSASIAEKLV